MIGASEGSRTPVTGLENQCNSRYTTLARRNVKPDYTSHSVLNNTPGIILNYAPVAQLDRAEDF